MGCFRCRGPGEEKVVNKNGVVTGTQTLRFRHLRPHTETLQGRTETGHDGSLCFVKDGEVCTSHAFYLDDRARDTRSGPPGFSCYCPCVHRLSLGLSLTPPPSKHTVLPTSTVCVPPLLGPTDLSRSRCRTEPSGHRSVGVPGHRLVRSVSLDVRVSHMSPGNIRS